ncbi:valine--tRNA ligase [Candidatus Pacearchaeota archaeon]|nr:valine--tRNA ligase [Candidatus Pacearchaeota archaeon]
MDKGKSNEDYNFKAVEEKWRKFWEKEGIYKFDSKSRKEIFSIDTPPPTVSGKMHIGHAFSYSQQDFIVRFKRMKGFNVFYPFGTDDNGVPTERLVEKVKKVRARDMTREKFIKLCMDFLKQELPKLIQDWKNIGISSDFKLYYSTISDYARKISQWSFLDLYKKGRLERRDAPSMWCPECQTGISQVEAKDKEEESTFNHIVFKVNGKDIIIATTRPELLPACVAVFYNTIDENYKKYKGKKARVPLFNFQVPIMEDERADPDKGTGIVMCCTFGDQTDMEWQRAYQLEIKEAITRDGRMTELAGKYKGMKINDARKAMLDDLKKAGLLVKQEKIKHFVNVHERCGTEIEFVKSKQWFVRYLDLKKEMLEWGSKLKWHPAYMKYRYDNWVNGLQWDWLISRQRYFGVPFPIWYCNKCHNVILADEKELPVDPLKDNPKGKCGKCGHNWFEPEKDVLDTWFTSSMTPRLAIELVSKKLQEKLFPMDLRPQSHDIITFWLFNTVIKSQLHYKKNPFRDVAVSGFVTLEGEKMSKSKGNIIEPQVVMDKFGADALRFWAAGSKLGEDINYEEKDVVAGKRFVIKILNAARFVFMNLKGKIEKPKKLHELDRLLLARINHIIKEATKSFESYEYARCKNDAVNFFWSIFTDNYLELVKRRVYSGTKEEKESAFYTLYHSLFTILKLMAPFTPFITEEIYHKHFKNHEKEESIHHCSWPDEFKIKEEKGDEEKFDLLLDVISKVRHEKSKNKKSVKAEIILTLEKEKINKLKDIIQDLKDVVNAKEIKEGDFKVEFV